MPIAAAIPVPRARNRKRSTPRPAPRRLSASPPLRRSCPSATGNGPPPGADSRSLRSRRMGTSRQPRLAENTAMPFSSSRVPGTATPAASAGCPKSRAPASRSAAARSRTLLTTASGPRSRSVGRRSSRRSVPSAATRAAFIPVPPTSRAMTCLTGDSVAVGGIKGLVHFPRRSETAGSDAVHLSSPLSPLPAPRVRAAVGWSEPLVIRGAEGVTGPHGADRRVPLVRPRREEHRGPPHAVPPAAVTSSVSGLCCSRTRRGRASGRSSANCRPPGATSR